MRTYSKETCLGTLSGLGLATLFMCLVAHCGSHEPGLAAADAGAEGGSSEFDPGRAISIPVKAAAGTTLTLPDGARLTIPPGALPTDLTLTVTVPTKQSAASTTFVYEFSPAGIALSSPATLVVPMQHLPSDQNLAFAFVSSIVNPIVNEGDEQTNWVLADVSGRDTASSTMSFQLHDFTVLYAIIAVDGQHRVYLVTDIPAQYLKPGDLLFTLTDYGVGPNWHPGHVAGFIGSGNPQGGPVDGIVEANGDKVVGSTLNDIDGGTLGLKNEPGHIYLGARRPTPALTSVQRAQVANFLLKQRGKGYALVGEQSVLGNGGGDPNAKFSCVGLCEAALQSAGSGTIPVFDRLTISTPLEQYLATQPVSDLEVCPGDNVEIPVYGVMVDAKSPLLFCTLRGWYTRTEPYMIIASSTPPGSSFTAQLLKGPQGYSQGYLLSWTPTPDQAGMTFSVGLHMDAQRVGCTVPWVDESVDRTLTLTVKSQADCATDAGIDSGPEAGTDGGSPGCLMEGHGCDLADASACCSNNCVLDYTGGLPGANPYCCLPPQSPCVAGGNTTLGDNGYCCPYLLGDAGAGANIVGCINNVCCVETGTTGCRYDSDCCSGLPCSPIPSWWPQTPGFDKACCLPDHSSCQINGQCCNQNCDTGQCCWSTGTTPSAYASTCSSCCSGACDGTGKCQ
jgi:hypothetical protein